jgi:hypothetical protein
MNRILFLIAFALPLLDTTTTYASEEDRNSDAISHYDIRGFDLTDRLEFLQEVLSAISDPEIKETIITKLQNIPNRRKRNTVLDFFASIYNENIEEVSIGELMGIISQFSAEKMQDINARGVSLAAEYEFNTEDDDFKGLLQVLVNCGDADDLGSIIDIAKEFYNERRTTLYDFAELIKSISDLPQEHRGRYIGLARPFWNRAKFMSTLELASTIDAISHLCRADITTILELGFELFSTDIPLELCSNMFGHIQDISDEHERSLRVAAAKSLLASKDWWMSKDPLTREQKGVYYTIVFNSLTSRETAAASGGGAAKSE